MHLVRGVREVCVQAVMILMFLMIGQLDAVERNVFALRIADPKSNTSPAVC